MFANKTQKLTLGFPPIFLLSFISDCQRLLAVPHLLSSPSKFYFVLFVYFVVKSHSQNR
jgi:hypothetical protein